MAERRAGAAGSTAAPPPSTASAGTPDPPPTLHLTLVPLPAGTVLHRVHHERYAAAQFNPGVSGNARFSPIQDDEGNPIPALYAGTTMDCALMETVYHDVPHTAGFKSLDKGKLAGQMHSVVQVEELLQLADLASVSLRKLGVTRKQLIDTEKDQYPATRKWAEAIHRQCPDAQGLSWISRQDDSARAVVLFGDRIPNGVVRPTGASRSLVNDAAAYDKVLDLAERIGVNIVAAKT